MKEVFSKTSLLLLLAGLGVGCGTLPAVPANEEEPNLSQQVFGAIWHSEQGDQLLVPTSMNLPSEDGLVHSNSILIPYPADGSTYVHGVFALDIPDRDQVQFVAQVGFAETNGAQAQFQIFIQDGETIPLLAETVATADGKLDALVADLSPYRGQNRMLVLSVTPLTDMQTMGHLWVEPSLRIP